MDNNDLDLWPADFGEISTTSPASILRKQAKALTERTNGVLRGDVSSRSSQGTFHHSLYVVAPTLKNYKYRLLKVSHGIGFYPATIDFHDREMNAFDEDDLIQALRTVLHSEEAKRVIQALLSQSNDPESFTEDDDDLPF